MRLLLDTQVLLWGATDPGQIGARTKQAIHDAERALVSVLAFAEIGIKVAIGKLEMPPGLRERVPPHDILQLRAEHGIAIGALPLHHRDPFDRLLIAQAMSERLTIVTSDSEFAQYDVPVIDARQ